jgi:Na+(H+)/acetate symporter ActP
MRMVYFARVGLYFNCILAILIPTLISGIFRKSSVRAARILGFTFYLIFYLYQIYSYNRIGGWSGFTLNL